MCAQEKTHLNGASLAMQPRIWVHLDLLQTELQELNRELHDRLQDHVAEQSQTALLLCVPGVDPIVAAVLMAEFPQLDCPNGCEIAALVRATPPELEPR